MLDIANPILATSHVAAYWDKIQGNEFAAKVLGEMDQGLRERQDGTETKTDRSSRSQAKTITLALIPIGLEPLARCRLA